MIGSSYSRADMDAAYEFLCRCQSSIPAPIEIEALARFRSSAREEERLATVAYMRETA